MKYIMIARLLSLLLIPTISFAAALPAQKITFSHSVKIDPIDATPSNCITIHLDNQPIGDLLHDTWARSLDGVVIENFYIEPIYRGKGYGHVLFEYALSKFSDKYQFALLMPFPFERTNNTLNGTFISKIPNRDAALKNLCSLYRAYGFEFKAVPIANKALMGKYLMPCNHALAQAARPIATQTVAGELA